MECLNALVIDGTCWKSQHTYTSILDGQIVEIKASVLAICQILLTANANFTRVIIFNFIKSASLDLLGDRASYRPKSQTPIFWIATTQRFLSEQLEWSSRNEKHAFTFVLSCSCKSQVLSVQSVWKRATSVSLTTKNTSLEAFAAGHRFSFNRDTDWSSPTTTKAWIAEILLLYQDERIQEHHLLADAKIISYLDCWSVHRSQEFRNWIQTEHPEIIVLYVPVGCTCSFQSCDFGLQRLFKHAVKQSAIQFFVDHLQHWGINNTAPGYIRSPAKIDVLCDAIPFWIINAI